MKMKMRMRMKWEKCGKVRDNGAQRSATHTRQHKAREGERTEGKRRKRRKRRRTKSEEKWREVVSDERGRL
jgi:hypothetical protein